MTHTYRLAPRVTPVAVLAIFLGAALATAADPPAKAPATPVRPLPPAKPLDPPKGGDVVPAEPAKPRPPRLTPQDKVHARGGPGAMPDEATRAALAHNVTLDFTDAPLDDIAAAIQAQTKLEIAIVTSDKPGAAKPADPKPTESKPADPQSAPPKTDDKPATPKPAGGASSQTSPGAKPSETAEASPRLTVRLKDVSASSALNLIANDLGWTWYAEQGQVLLTEDNVLPVVAEVYNVRDLVLPPSAGDGSPDETLDYDQLSDIISGTLDFPSPTPDSPVPTPDCSPFHGTLTIAQDQRLQDRVARLLAALRQAKSLPRDQYKAVANAGIGISPLDQSAVNKALEKPVEGKVTAAKLDELSDWLRKTAGVSVHVDAAARKAGFQTPSAEQMDVTGAPLGQALDLLLVDSSLGYAVHDEALVITSKQNAAESRSVRVYPVGDLISGDPERDGVDDDFARLLDVITRSVEPESWATLDKAKSGNAYVGYLPAAKAFVCDQTRAGHEQVAAVMAKLRKAIGEQPTTASKPAVEPEKEKKRPLSLKIYKLNSDLTGEDFVAVVRDLVEPATWGGEAYIHAVPGAVVVKQTPAIQRRVEKMLVQLGAIPDPKKMPISGAPTLVGHRKSL